jgi:phosphoribosylanthranilate isomerase
MISTVKICGLSTAPTLEAALAAGADMVGLVFFARSPRFVSLDQAAALAARVRGRAKIVALTVDAGDEALAAIVAKVSPDMLQLHGSETPARTAAIKRAFGRQVMKAIGVSQAGDFARARDYEGVADWLLIDAKPPKDASRPGGNGRPFDWRLARDFTAKIPWLLSGGLDADNVGEAVELSRATGVDVSSGVERAPGVKDEGRIAAFAAAARVAFARAQELRSPA